MKAAILSVVDDLGRHARPPALAATGTKATSRRTLFKLVAGQPFFGGMRRRHLERLAGLAMEVHFLPGQSIFKEGDPANRFYLIMDGKVQLEMRAKNQNALPLRILGPGDDLGWAWLFDPYFFRATARAIAPTRAIFFYGTVLRQYCEDDYYLGYEIMRRVAIIVVQSHVAMQENLVERAQGKFQPPMPATTSVPNSLRS